MAAMTIGANAMCEEAFEASEKTDFKSTHSKSKSTMC